MNALLTAFFVLLTAGTASAQDVPLAYEAASAIHLEFVSDPTSLGLSRPDGEGGWEQIGLSPCTVTLPPGTIELALTYQNHAPMRVPIAIDISEGERLTGHYESRQTLRELGVGIVFGSLVGVLIGIAIAAGGFLAHDVDVGVGGLIGAASVGVVGGTTGITLATLDDIATIDIL